MTRVLSFRQWPILLKIMTISVVSVSFMSATILFYFAPQIERRLVEEKKERLKSVVEVAFAVFRDYDALVRSGRIPAEEAKAQAAQKIRELRYGEESEYFWINDLQPRVVMHPLKPDMEGQDVTDEVDPGGRRHWVDFVRAVRSDPAGAGFVTYLWAKPGMGQPVEKLSYVKLYAPWGWIIGTGIHIDDVRRDMSRIRWMLIAGNIFFIVVTLSLAALVGAGIRRPLQRVIEGLKDIASGKGDIALHRRIAISSIDEIGLLSSEFNSLMESIGHLTVFKKVIEEEDSVEEVYHRLGEVFSKQLALPDCRIYEVAGGDALTGLHNRRYLQEFADKIVSGALRRRKSVGLVLCDLDHFKQVNDTYGHDVGDLVLKESARLIAGAVRESDLVVRFGGEEFLVVLLDIADGEAMQVAEKIRERVEAAKIQVSQGVLKKTLSLGVSEFPNDATNLWQCIKYADLALYKAKESGRNRAVRFTGDLSSGQGS